MRAALALAWRGVGQTGANPAVGCVLVREGRVVGRGWTAPGGRPHAETLALGAAGKAARGATAYVTLEPCCHWGQTPPCTDALIAAGVARVVVGHGDPDPRVDGGGIARLRQAGIVVQTGVLAAETAEPVAGFLSRVRRGRPAVTLKLATTLDGRIATAAGESQWISAEPARRMVHAMRARHDAVMVGVNTVLADNPDLTCRLDGARTAPGLRIIADSRLRTPLTARVVATAARYPTLFIVQEGTDAARRNAVAELGIKVIEVAGTEAGIDLPAAMRRLGEEGVNSVLAEGGARLAAALLRADLVDRIAWFHAPSVMGGDGLAAVRAFGIRHLDAMPRFERAAVTAVGPDTLTAFRRAAA
ncbi:MAG: bifunctional diaminohydroxyphosphoribosylaminopyrimidine deaminase/5-amino-6-(5-phosphoribosylamino)uracil reductase RibD [Acetobacteraceae bacterium]|nr:bifunctional diaminohydroxyphosphoribosylaminopyrimidine deaminase/5-amino-6-(5-phosphoribosylamino)uracil reductase RibD [Acetobacteraceae bacterium]